MLICPQCRREFDAAASACPTHGAVLCHPTDLDRLGCCYGSYQVVEILGVGGMGVVYKALHTTLGKTVAIKILNERYGHRDEAANEILREARAASRIQSPHIVDVTDFGTTPEGAAFLVMEYLRGESLQAHLARVGRLTVTRAKRVVGQVADALNQAHLVGIVHRDLKPENIFLLAAAGYGSRLPPTEDAELFIKVLDFGLAKTRDLGPSYRTKAGVVAGTPFYMSPEQALNRSVDARSDVYALGVVFFQMVTGALPFSANSAVEVLMAHLKCPPPQPYRFNPEVDDATSRVILKCMEKDPVRRFQDMAALGRAVASAPGDDANASAAVEGSGGASGAGDAPLRDADSRAGVAEPVIAPTLDVPGKPRGERAAEAPPAEPTESSPTVSAEIGRGFLSQIGEATVDEEADELSPVIASSSGRRAISPAALMAAAGSASARSPLPAGLTPITGAVASPLTAVDSAPVDAAPGVSARVDSASADSAPTDSPAADSQPHGSSVPRRMPVALALASVLLGASVSLMVWGVWQRPKRGAPPAAKSAGLTAQRSASAAAGVTPAGSAQPPVLLDGAFDRTQAQSDGSRVKSTAGARALSSATAKPGSARPKRRGHGKAQLRSRYVAHEADTSAAAAKPARTAIAAEKGASGTRLEYGEARPGGATTAVAESRTTPTPHATPTATRGGGADGSDTPTRTKPARAPAPAKPAASKPAGKYKDWVMDPFGQ